MSQHYVQNPKTPHHIFLKNLNRILAIFAATFMAVILIGFVLEYRGEILTADVLGVQEIAQGQPELLQPHKTLWDLFQLLIIPIMVAVGAAYLETSSRERQFFIEEEHRQDQRIRDYFSNIQSFILHSKLLHPPDNQTTQALAQAFTRDLTKEVSGKRIGLLVDFLESYGLNLICGEDPIISLQEVNLKSADFQDLKLSRVNFSSARLNKSNWRSVEGWDLIANNCQFHRADMRQASFYNCHFQGADFRRADLRGASFDSCDLRGAILDSADLRGAIFHRSNLRGVSWNRRTRFNRHTRTIFKLVNGMLSAKQGLDDFDLSECDLAGLNLKDFKLRRANLCGSVLNGAQLEGAKLGGALLYQAELKDISLDQDTELEAKWKLVADILTHPRAGRKLLDEDLSYAFLEDAYLHQADLTGANLVGANLLGADLSGCNLTNAMMQKNNRGGQWVDHTQVEQSAPTGIGSRFTHWAGQVGSRLRGAIRRTRPFAADYYCQDEILLTYADMSGANLSGVLLQDRGLELVNLTGVTLSDQTGISDKWKKICDIMRRPGTHSVTLNLSHEDLSSACLRNANLAGVDLTYANLEFCDLESANLHKAKLQHANLSFATLRLANLSKANLTCAALHDANLAEAKIHHTILNGADLRNASFCEADFDTTDLSTAIVFHADFRGCRFKNTIIPKTPETSAA